MDNGEGIAVRAMEFKSGLTVQNTKASGSMARPMEKVFRFIYRKVYSC